MGSGPSSIRDELPFTDRNFNHHIEQVKKLHTKTSKARRRVLENLSTSSGPMLDNAKEALTLSEATTYFEQLIAHYPSKTEVWELYATFQELTHNEFAAEQCQKRVATLRHFASLTAQPLRRIASMSAQVSPRADVRRVLAEKSPEQIQRERELVDNAPHEYLCPITLEIMKAPVIAPDGFTFVFDGKEDMKKLLSRNG